METGNDDQDSFSIVHSDTLIETEELLRKVQTDLGIETRTHVLSAVIIRISKGTISPWEAAQKRKTPCVPHTTLNDVDSTERTTRSIIIAPTRGHVMQTAREHKRVNVRQSAQWD